jgi:hypothetical protein
MMISNERGNKDRRQTLQYKDATRGQATTAESRVIRAVQAFEAKA